MSGPQGNDSAQKKHTERKKNIPFPKHLHEKGNGPINNKRNDMSGNNSHDATKSTTTTTSMQRQLLRQQTPRGKSSSAKEKAPVMNSKQMIHSDAEGKYMNVKELTRFLKTSRDDYKDEYDGSEDSLQRHSELLDEDIVADAKDDIESDFIAGAIRSGVALALSTMAQQSSQNEEMQASRDYDQSSSSSDVNTSQTVPVYNLSKNMSYSNFAAAADADAVFHNNNNASNQIIKSLPLDDDNEDDDEEQPNVVSDRIGAGRARISTYFNDHHELRKKDASEDIAVTTTTGPSENSQALIEDLQNKLDWNSFSDALPLPLNNLLPLLGLGHQQQTLQAKVALESKCMELEKALTKSDTMLQSYKQKSEQDITSQNILTNEVSRLKSSLTTTQASLTATEEENSKLKGRFSKAEEELFAEKRKRKECVEEVTALRHQYQDMTDRNKKVIDENLLLKSQLTKTTIELDAMNSKSEELVSKCEEQQHLIKKLENAQSISQSELVSARSASRNKSNELASARKEIDMLQQDLHNLREEFDASVARILQEKGQQALDIVRAEHEVSQASALLEQERSTLEAEKATTASLQQRICTLQSIESDLRKELAALTSDLQDANRRERSAEEAMIALNARFDEALRKQTVEKQTMNFNMEAKDKCMKNSEQALAEARMREKMYLRQIELLRSEIDTSNTRIDADADVSTKVHGVLESSKRGGVDKYELSNQKATLVPSHSNGSRSNTNVTSTEIPSTSISYARFHSSSNDSNDNENSFAGSLDMKLLQLGDREQTVIEALDREQKALCALNKFKNTTLKATSSLVQPSSSPIGNVGQLSSSLSSSSLSISDVPAQLPRPPSPSSTSSNGLLEMFGFVAQ